MPTPEKLRCNVEVIRPHDQASDGSFGQPGQTSSASVTIAPPGSLTSSAAQ